MQHANRRLQLHFRRKLKSDLAFEDDGFDWPRYLAWLVFFFFLSWLGFLVLSSALLHNNMNPLVFLRVPIYYGFIFFMPFFFSMLATRSLEPQHTTEVLLLIIIPALIVRVFTFPIETSLIPMLFSLGATSAGIIIAKHL